MIFLKCSKSRDYSALDDLKKGNFVSRQNWKIGRTIITQISKKGNILFLSN